MKLRRIKLKTLRKPSYLLGLNRMESDVNARNQLGDSALMKSRNTQEQSLGRKKKSERVKEWKRVAGAPASSEEPSLSLSLDSFALFALRKSEKEKGDTRRYNKIQKKKEDKVRIVSNRRQMIFLWPRFFPRSLSLPLWQKKLNIYVGK